MTYDIKVRGTITISSGLSVALASFFSETMIGIVTITGHTDYLPWDAPSILVRGGRTVSFESELRSASNILGHFKSMIRTYAAHGAGLAGKGMGLLWGNKILHELETDDDCVIIQQESEYNEKRSEDSCPE